MPPRTIAERFGIIPNRSNLRRIDNANAILRTGKVQFLKIDGGDRLFAVQSQYSNRSYQVRVNHTFTSCSCPDWQRANKQLKPEIPVCRHYCKHGIAVGLSLQNSRGGQHQSPSPKADFRDQIKDIIKRLGLNSAENYIKHNVFHEEFNPTGKYLPHDLPQIGIKRRVYSRENQAGQRHS